MPQPVSPLGWQDTDRIPGGLKKRDFEEVLNTDHNKTDLGYTLNTDAETLFSGQNSCVLTPEVTQGPYCKSPYRHT